MLTNVLPKFIKIIIQKLPIFLIKANFVRYLLILLIFNTLHSQNIDKLLDKVANQTIQVDLRQPIYSAGVLSTQNGGVVSGPDLRIQALKISYISQQNSQVPVWSIEAQEDLIVEFGDYVFVGEKLVYDFIKKEGVIYQGKSMIAPWHFGGKEIMLCADGSYLVREGYVTTSEKQPPQWGIYSQQLQLNDDDHLSAKRVTIKIGQCPVLWIPCCNLNLNYIFDCPIRYRFRWGGRQGPRVGLTYEIFSWQGWKTFLNLDYKFTYGPGGGLDIYYDAPDHLTTFESINYLANDSSVFNSEQKVRYRFEGAFNKQMSDDKTSILLSYDKISERDYYERDFDLGAPKRTQLLIRRQTAAFITNFYTHVRINSFQTVKQELPSFEVNFKPFAIGKTGIICENFFNASYLNFVYSKKLCYVHDYSSTRFEYRSNFYRPFSFDGMATLTPEIGIISIIYGNCPEGGSRWLTLCKMKCLLNTHLYSYYTNLKHVVEPYGVFNFYSAPTVSVDKHYVFDLDDGLARLYYFSFGLKNFFYIRNGPTNQQRFCAHLYTDAFLDSHTIKQTIPRLYTQFSFMPNARTEHSINFGWNLQHQQCDYFNLRSALTLSDDLAITMEYRHRGPYAWRKVDYDNFFLDAYRSQKRLLHSSLSDPRDTILTHIFYRFNPNWACDFVLRQGWRDRRDQKNYLEYEVNLLTTIQTAWNLRFSFQRQVYDTRVAIYMSVGLKKPEITLPD